MLILCQFYATRPFLICNKLFWYWFDPLPLLNNVKKLQCCPVQASLMVALMVLDGIKWPLCWPAVKAKIMWRPQSLYSSRTAQQPIKRACYVTFVRFLVFSNTLSVIIFFWSYSGPIKLKLPKETALIGTFLECVQKYPPRPTIMMILDVCTLPDRVQVFPI